MSTTRPPSSPVPGVLPEPVSVQDPAAEREARYKAREERRAPVSERPPVMIPSRQKRLPLEAPLMRLVATGGIVGIAVVIAAIMSAKDLQGWMIGLVASVVSLVLAAILWSSRRL